MADKAIPLTADQAQSAAHSEPKPLDNHTNMIEKCKAKLTDTVIGVLENRYNLRAQIELSHRLAESFRGKGLLVIASFGQDPQTGEKLIPKIRHSRIGEIDEDVQWIEKVSKEQHRNVYMSQSIYRLDLPHRSKGSEADIVAVLGLVADFDDKDAGNWKKRIPLDPSLVLETSPGRFQVFYLFSRQLPPDQAKRLAVALKAFCKCDHGTADISHVWRLIDVPNWPNQKKFNEGRALEPWTVKAVEAEQNLIDPDQIAESLKDSITDCRRRAYNETLTDIESLNDVDLLPISFKTKELIRMGAEGGHRSEAMQTVLCALVGAGVSEDNIYDIFEENQIGEKYREKGINRRKWLKPQIDKAVEFIGRRKTVEEVRVEMNEKFSAGNLTDETWTELLYSINPNQSDVDKVLEFLVGLGVGKKQALKARYNERKKELDKIEARQRKARIVAKAGREKKTIVWDDRNLNGMVEQTEEALIMGQGKMPYLQYANCHSYVATEQPSTGHAIDSRKDKPPAVPVIKRYCSNSLRLTIEQSACFIIEKDEGPEQIPVPRELASLLLDYPSSKAPVITGLVNHPLVTSEGRFINSQGYDPSTQLYFNYGGISFPQLEIGNQEMARKLFDEIVEDMFCEFAWENIKLDRAVAVSILLTTLLRKLMDIAPAYVVTANLQGSGKTTLLRIIHIVVTGHDMPVSTLSEDIQEVRKSMLALLMESAAMIVFDNVPDGYEVRNDILAKVLTSPFFKDRLLGATKQVSVPTKSVIALTGNNITMDADLGRRIVPLSLLPKELMPEKRHFKHPDILAWSQNIRIRMITKALSIVSMYLNSDRSDLVITATNSGFPMWDAMVRFPILWASGVDIVDAIDQARMSSNDLLTRKAAISALSKAFPNRVEFTASDVFRMIDNSCGKHFVEVRDTFMEMSHNTARNVSSVGWALKKLLNFPCDYGILSRRTSGHSNKYFIAS